MQIIDISMRIRSDMLTYPGDRKAQMRKARALTRGDPYNLTELDLSAHTGTHVDAPNHFLHEGVDISTISLERFVGVSRVLDLRGVKFVEEKDLRAQRIGEGERILLKTDNSVLLKEDRFYENHVYITHDGARYLKERGILLLGFDYISIEEHHAGEPLAHLELLMAGIPVLEGLDLSGVEEGEYFLVALPLSLGGAEASPVRAVLLIW